MGAGASASAAPLWDHIVPQESVEGNTALKLQKKTKSWFDYVHARYIPNIVLERFGTADARPLLAAEHTRFDAAVAFVDISGFTKLSEKLMQDHGTGGAELLNKFVSAYFEKLIEVIVQWGGDIIKFAGDAMLVVWRNGLQRGHDAAKATRILGDGDESLATLVFRAVSCNLALIATLNNFRPVDGVCLTLHSGIGAGQLSGFFVGGVKSEWEFFVAGEPVQQMALAGDEAASGQVVLSRFAHAQVAAAAVGKEIASGNFLVVGIAGDAAPTIFKREQHVTPSVMEETLDLCLERRMRLEAGHKAEWLAEYRRVFIMFCKLPDIDYSDQNVLSILQPAIVAVQSTIDKFEGAVARLLADDKGTRFKIAFGMPSCQHEDDAERVVRAALEIQDRLGSLKISSSIGIACGVTFCGEAGSSMRCEYTCVGFKVNVAARLMQAAQGGVLCDEETFSAACHDIQFDRLVPIPLKGIAVPVEIFRPLGKIGLTRGKSVKMLGLVPKPNQHSPLKRAQTYGTNHSRQSSPISKHDVHSRNNAESNSKPSAPPSPVRTPSPQPRSRDSSKISSESSTFMVRRMIFDSPNSARSENEQTVSAVSEDGSIATFEEHIERKLSVSQPNLQPLPVTFEAVTIPGSLSRQIRNMEADFALLQQVKDVGYFQRGRSNSITNAEKSPRDRLKNPRFRSNPEPEMLALALVHNTMSGDIQQKQQELQHHAASEVRAFFTVDSQRQSDSACFGRKVDLSIFATALQAFRNGVDGSKRVFFIHGDAGVGKTLLINHALNEARPLRLAVHAGACLYLEHATPFYPFRSLLSQALGLEGVLQLAGRRELVLKNLPIELHGMAFLLNPILQCNFADESSVTDKLTQEHKQTHTRTLILLLCTAISVNAKTVFLLEDMQWSDTHTWRTMAEVVKLPNAFIVFSARPLPRPEPLEYSNLIRSRACHVVKLEHFSKAETHEIVLSKLKARELQHGLTDLVFAKTQGHPFHVDVLLISLQERNLLVKSEEGTVALVASVSLKDLSAMPETTNAIVIDRIDRLDAKTQLTLKVCSVIGSEFSLKLIAETHPANESSKLILAQLEQLEAANFLERLPAAAVASSNDASIQASVGSSTFVFKSRSVSEVAYSLLLVQQRKLVHLRIAKYFEASLGAADLAERNALMAHHFNMAEEWPRALLYAELAAQNAVLQGSWTEALENLTLAAELCAKQAHVEPMRLERILVAQTQTLFALGRHEAAAAHLEKALELHGMYLIPDIDGIAWFARWMQSAGIGSVFACCFAQIFPLEARINATNLRLTDRQVQLLLYYCQSASLCRDQGAELFNLKATQASCMLESYLCWATDFQPASKLTFWQCAAKIEVMYRRLLQIQTPRFDRDAPGAAASAPNELAVRADAQTMLGSLKSLCVEFNNFSAEQQGQLQLRLAHVAAVMADMAVATDLIKRAMISFQNSNQCGVSQVREGHAMLGAIEIMAGRFDSAQVSLNSSIRLARSSDDAYTERAAVTLQTIILLLQWSSSSAPEVQGAQVQAMALLETLITGAGRCSSRARRDQLPESDAKQGIPDSSRAPREFESSNDSVETILARATRMGAARGNRDSRDGAGAGAEVGFAFCMALDEYLKCGSESAIVARLRATVTASRSEQWAQLQCWQSFIEFALVCVLVLKAAEARCSAMGAAKFRNENTYTSTKSAPASEHDGDHVFLELMSQATLVCAFLGSWGHRFPLVAPFARAASSWYKWIGACGGARSGSELGSGDNTQSVATVKNLKSMDAVQRRHALLNCIDELGRAEAAFAANGLELFRAIVGTWHARAHSALKSIVAMAGPVQTMHESLSSTRCDEIIKNATRLHCAIRVSPQHPFFELPHADIEVPLGECAYACRQS